MTLREYINKFPKGERMRARKIIADTIGVSESTVRSWENGTRKLPINKYGDLIAKITNNEVSRDELVI